MSFVKYVCDANGHIWRLGSQ